MTLPKGQFVEVAQSIPESFWARFNKESCCLALAAMRLGLGRVLVSRLSLEIETNKG